MTDVLIRDVPEDDLRRIDRKAARLGISRTEYLRRRIAQDAHQDTGQASARVTAADFAKFADLADEELMRDAWS